MNDSQMLQAILDEIHGLRKEVYEFKKDVKDQFKRVYTHIEGVEHRLTERIDAIGKTVAYLEDDTPTQQEFDLLEKRVTVVETSLVLK